MKRLIYRYIKFLKEMVFYRILSATGIPSTLRQFAKKRGNYVVLFHGIHLRDYNLSQGAQNDLLLIDFIRVLDWLEREFKFISPKEFFTPGTSGGVLVTFDDGFRNNFVNALPILAKRNIPVLIFVSSKHVMSPTDLLWFSRKRALKHWNTLEEIPSEILSDLYSGISVNELREALLKYPNLQLGAHTHSHPDLPGLSNCELKREILDHKDWLQRTFNVEIEYFAYPRGLIDAQSRSFVSRLFSAAFSVDDFEKNDIYKLPRVSIHSSDKHYLDIKFSPLHKPQVSFKEF